MQQFCWSLIWPCHSRIGILRPRGLAQAAVMLLRRRTAAWLSSLGAGDR